MVGGWLLAEWAYTHFGCQAVSKGLAPCFAHGVEITWFVGFGLFWCRLLAWVAVPLSLWLLVRAFEQQRSEQHNGVA
jgi:hypothetical protein